MRYGIAALLLLFLAPRAHAQWQLDFIGVPAVLPELFGDIEALYENGTVFLQIRHTGASPAQGYLNYLMITDNASPRGVSSSEIQIGIENATRAGYPFTRALSFGFGAIPISFSGVGVLNQTPAQLDDLVGWTHTRDEALLLSLLQAGTLPEGTHSFYVWLSSEPRGAGTLLAETGFSRTVITPGSPDLLSPTDGAMVRQSLPTFTWTPPTLPLNVSNVAYQFRMVEVLGSQTANDAIRGNRIHFETVVEALTALNYPVSALSLEHGRRYAWQITTVRDGRPFGRLPSSPVFTFTYTDPNAEGTLSLVAPQGTPYASLRAGDNTRFTFTLDPAFDLAQTPWQDVQLEIVRTWDPSIDVGAWVSSLDGTGFDDAIRTVGRSRATHQVPVLLEAGGRQGVEFSVPEQNGFDQALAWRFRGMLNGRTFTSPIRVAIVQSNQPPVLEAEAVAGVLLTGNGREISYSASPEGAWNRVRVQIMHAEVTASESAATISQQLATRFDQFARVANTRSSGSGRSVVLREEQVPVAASGRFTLTLPEGANDVAFAYRVVGTPRRGRDVVSESSGYGYQEGTSARTPATVSVSGTLVSRGSTIQLQAPAVFAQAYQADGAPMGDRVQGETDDEGGFTLALPFTERTVPTAQRPVRIEITTEQNDGYFAATHAEALTAQNVTGVNVNLRPREIPVALEGRVLDTAGEPVSGADLILSLSLSSQNINLQASTLSTADGSFRVLVRWPGDLELALRGAQLTATVEPGAVNTRLVQDVFRTNPVLYREGIPEYVIRLPLRPGSLTTEVAAGTIPQSGVPVRLRGTGSVSNVLLMARTADNGRATFSNLTPGTYQVDYPTNRFIPALPAGTFVVRPGEETRVPTLAASVAQSTYTVHVRGDVTGEDPVRVYAMSRQTAAEYVDDAPEEPTEITTLPYFYTEVFTQPGTYTISLPTVTSSGGTVATQLNWVAHSKVAPAILNVQHRSTETTTLSIRRPTRNLYVRVETNNTAATLQNIAGEVTLSNGTTLTVESETNLLHIPNLPAGVGGTVRVTSRRNAFGAFNLPFEAVPDDESVTLTRTVGLHNGAVRACLRDENGAIPGAMFFASVGSNRVRTNDRMLATTPNCFQINNLAPSAATPVEVVEWAHGNTSVYQVYTLQAQVRPGEVNDLGEIVIPFKSAMLWATLHANGQRVSGLQVTAPGASRISDLGEGNYQIEYPWSERNNDIAKRITFTPTEAHPGLLELNYSVIIKRTASALRQDPALYAVTMPILNRFSVSGTVTNRENGQPVAGARVRSNGFVVETDAQGRYSLVMGHTSQAPTLDVVVEHSGWVNRRTIDFGTGINQTNINFEIGTLAFDTLMGFPVRITSQTPQGERGVLISGELVPGRQGVVEWTSIPFSNLRVDPSTGAPLEFVVASVRSIPVRIAGHDAVFKEANNQALVFRDNVLTGVIEFTGKSVRNGTVNNFAITANCPHLCITADPQEMPANFTVDASAQAAWGPRQGPHGQSGQRQVNVRQLVFQNATTLAFNGFVAYENNFIEVTGLQYQTDQLGPYASLGLPEIRKNGAFAVSARPGQRADLLDNGLLRIALSNLDIDGIGANGQSLTIPVQGLEYTPQGALHRVDFERVSTLPLMGQTYTVQRMSYSTRNGGTVHSDGTFLLPAPLSVALPLQDAQFTQTGQVTTPIWGMEAFTFSGASLAQLNLTLTPASLRQPGGRIRMATSIGLNIPGLPSSSTAFEFARGEQGWTLNDVAFQQNNFLLGKMYVVSMQIRYRNGEYSAATRMHPTVAPRMVIDANLSYRDTRNWSIFMGRMDLIPFEIPGVTMGAQSGSLSRSDGDWRLRIEGLTKEIAKPSKPAISGNFEFGSRGLNFWIDGELTFFDGIIKAGEGDIWVSIGERTVVGNLRPVSPTEGTFIDAIVDARLSFNFRIVWDGSGVTMIQAGGETSLRVLGVQANRGYVVFGYNARPFTDPGFDFIRTSLPNHPSSVQSLNGFYYGMRTAIGGSVCCGLRAGFETSTFFIYNHGDRAEGQLYMHAYASLDWKIISLSAQVSLYAYVLVQNANNYTLRADGNASVRGCVIGICATFTIRGSVAYSNNSFSASVSL